MERSKENYERYFLSYLIANNDVEEIKKCFFETSPMFESYDDFIKFCMSENDNNEMI